MEKLPKISQEIIERRAVSPHDTTADDSEMLTVKRTVTEEDTVTEDTGDDSEGPVTNIYHPEALLHSRAFSYFYYFFLTGVYWSHVLLHFWSDCYFGCHLDGR